MPTCQIQSRRTSTYVTMCRTATVYAYVPNSQSTSTYVQVYMATCQIHSRRLRMLYVQVCAYVPNSPSPSTYVQVSAACCLACPPCHVMGMRLLSRAPLPTSNDENTLHITYLRIYIFIFVYFGSMM